MKNIKKNYNNDTRKMAKRFLIYLVIVFAIFLVTSTVLTILKVQTWAIFLFNIAFGGGFVFVAEMIYRKRRSKKEAKKLMSDKPDTFA